MRRRERQRCITGERHRRIVFPRAMLLVASLCMCADDDWFVGDFFNRSNFIMLLLFYFIFYGKSVFHTGGRDNLGKPSPKNFESAG